MVNLWLIIGITIYLVGGDWNMNCIFFHSVGNGIIIPTDELTPSFFRGVGEKPPTKIFWVKSQKTSRTCCGTLPSWNRCYRRTIGENTGG